ncbi:uncharacterized protein UHO2_00383 [Ustilago hordei]|uniref:uncharacterized protein n=1 Tax=Ustilago hordei TaxID=120017 RepID=UPI001A3D3F1B|nr:uncharacterized protein UHO2_00383 [Ustilago hordei]SYW81879.1 uncharacterized protein UHO2_00383 [Ustilago hordei]
MTTRAVTRRACCGTRADVLAQTSDPVSESTCASPVAACTHRRHAHAPRNPQAHHQRQTKPPNFSAPSFSIHQLSLVVHPVLRGYSGTTQPQHLPVTGPSLPMPRQLTARTSRCPVTPSSSSFTHPLHMPSCDQASAQLLPLQNLRPPPWPNTRVAQPLYNPAGLPTHHGTMQASLAHWRQALQNYPDHLFVTQLLGAIRHGVNLGYSSPLRNTPRFCTIWNLPMDSQSKLHLQHKLETHLQEGRLVAVDPTQSHLSDLADAFRHVVTTLDDAWLLGFTFNGQHYMEMGLTFGGRSSRWLFNLFAEALHWVLQSTTHHPVEHYLDDFFGAVPVASNPCQPLHSLTIACSALGLCLVPQKTFWDTTKLEVLGIEVDTVWQCIGITPKRRQRILDAITMLLAQRSAHLIDWQHIAGLLQFVSQVVLHGRAYLRRLYDTSKTAHHHPFSLFRISQPAAAELRWWKTTLRAWPGYSLLQPSPLVVKHIWTDASKCSYGAHQDLMQSPSAALSWEVPCRHCMKDIRFLEALAVLEALRAFSTHWTGPRLVVLHIDNTNVEFGLHTGRSRDPLMQTILCAIFGLCFQCHNTLHPSFIWSHFGPGVPPFPATDLFLTEWVCDMAQTHSFHSLKHELDALCSWHVDLGFPLEAFSHGCLEHVVHGIKHTHGLCPTASKHPITLPLLWALLQQLPPSASLGAWDWQVVAVAFCISFACFLHCGEVTWDLTSPTQLLVHSITWHEDYAIVLLLASKTNPFWLGMPLVVPKIGGLECPYVMLHLLCPLVCHPLAPLFGLQDSYKPLT